MSPSAGSARGVQGKGSPVSQGREPCAQAVSWIWGVGIPMRQRRESRVFSHSHRLGVQEAT